jgi:hypothetical protein
MMPPTSGPDAIISSSMPSIINTPYRRRTTDA